MVAPDGAVYVGGWSDDGRSGNGTEVKAGGERYVGGFERDRRSGFGVVTGPAGQVTYRGYFR